MAQQGPTPPAIVAEHGTWAGQQWASQGGFSKWPRGEHNLRFELSSLIQTT